MKSQPLPIKSNLNDLLKKVVVREQVWAAKLFRTCILDGAAREALDDLLPYLSLVGVFYAQERAGNPSISLVSGRWK